MTWFVVHFLPGAPLGPAMASGPWADRDLGSLSMDEWRNADEVREVTEHAERPGLPEAAFEWEHTPHDEYLTAKAMGRAKRGRPPMQEGAKTDVFSVRFTPDQREVIERAASMSGKKWRAWSRWLLVTAAQYVVDNFGPLTEESAQRLLDQMVRDGLVRIVDPEAHEQVEEAPHPPSPPTGPHEDPIEGHGQAAPPAASGPDGELARQADAVEEAERAAHVHADEGAAEREARRSEALTAAAKIFTF